MKLMIAAGGTGGHLFPGIAVAEILRQMNPSGDVLFVGSDRGLEREILQREGLRHEALNVGRIKGEGFVQRFKTLMSLPRSFFQARALIKKYQPDVVLGIGGYSSGPVILAAWLMRIPRAILEPNTIPGFTNRMLSRLVNRIFIAFPEAGRFFPKGKTKLTGTPVRGALTQIGRERKTSEEDLFRLVVLGGSQGATALNEAMMRLIPQISGKKIQVIHQTGKADFEKVQESYKKGQLNSEVHPFIGDMAGVFRKADLIVSRAGASTLAELISTCSPSILIPYPFAADDHQRFNARSLEERGGADVILNKELGEKLGDRIFFYLEHREELQKKREALKKIQGIPAAESVTKEILSLLLMTK